MKVYGIKAAYLSPLRPEASGVVSLVGEDGARKITLAWNEIPPMAHHEWRDLAINGTPLAFEHGRDAWHAPDFVRCLYLRTSPDRNEYIALTPKTPEPCTACGGSGYDERSIHDAVLDPCFECNGKRTKEVQDALDVERNRGI